MNKFFGKLFVLSLLYASGASAHHSFLVHFEPERVVTVTGTVNEYRFRNPHALLHIEVEASSGEAISWTAETNSPSRLRRRGWSADSVLQGDQVTVEGYQSRDGRNYMRLARLILPNGNELIGHQLDAGEQLPEE